MGANPMQTLWGDTRSWFIAGSIVAGAVILSLIVHYVVFFLAARFSQREGSRFGDLLVQRAKKPALFILPLTAVVIALPAAPFPSEVRVELQRLLGLGAIAAIGWIAILIVDLVSDAIYSRYTIEVADNLAARRIRTQTELLHRIAIVVTVTVTTAIMLMTFPSVRHIGVSLLASAGLVGLVVGMAARSTLANLIAGFQVALTQPIRLDDSVVVEGEWGWIEEIGTTYVVVRIWDLRRLIVPLTYFIEKPFENWTRTTADLLGAVILYADYRLPVDDARREFRRILESSNLWDKKVCVLQVTDVTEKTMQLRALMSASNASKLFDLRCYVRETNWRAVRAQVRCYPCAYAERDVCILIPIVGLRFECEQPNLIEKNFFA
jgi:small-conductance mechanosensitive channel